MARTTGMSHPPTRPRSGASCDLSSRLPRLHSPSEYMLEPGAHRRGSLSGAHVQESKPDALPSSPRLSAASSPPPAYKRASFSTSVPQSSSSFATPPVEDMQLNLAEQANTSGALRTDKEALHALQVKLEDVQSGRSERCSSSC